MSRALLLRLALGLAPVLSTAACAAGPAAPAAVGPADWPFTAMEAARFDEPWALAFLPDRSLLVTEKAGRLIHLDPASGVRGEITGVPGVAYGGQGGFGDIALHPGFADNGLVYYSYAEAGDGRTRGAAVARARLVLDADGGGRLVDPQVIWRQTPKVEGDGHYGHRLLFGPDGKLWISSSERQKFDPAQDMGGNLGKLVRLNDDGSVPADNPFAADGPPADQVWSLGHRNILGLAFDADGRLWENEMGPKGGDELNLIRRGGNYGYPLVSNGDHYDGRPIPDHATRPEFIAPAVSWTPVISPSSLIVYRGALFPQWKGDAFIGGLSSQSLVRVALEGERAHEAERFDMGKRIRAVAEDADGALWLLEDGSGARLLKLTPAP
ncbi:PQQ-dependent sugar dehydrogenase [Stenotrophomonas mori]|uniref:PQQ-dependent sugar dehydrogenase n=1 Tax=Stenotrophomonas mori TaxID=2871096 RepID=A0ABT0SJS7_9GAMM|nr:PQQ-dependent sugar dehydrogenase [Stenotrophomonas mori]MCL7715507.1 PQQ-dependent sugar dehydrogenase [Stenotrophomonas mori]